VVEEREREDGESLEVSRNLIAMAEDAGKIVGSGPADAPAGFFTETIRVRETNPLEGDKGYEIFAAGVDTIIDGPTALVSYSVNRR